MRNYFNKNSIPFIFAAITNTEIRILNTSVSQTKGILYIKTVRISKWKTKSEE